MRPGGVPDPLTSMSNEDLLLLVQQNQPQSRNAFDELFRRLRLDLVVYLVYMGVAPDLAEDVFQDVFLWLWTRRGTDFRGGRFIPWIRTVAWRWYLDIRRERRRENFEESFDDLSVEGSSLLENVEAEELLEAVQDSLAFALEQNERDILQLAAFEGVPSTEIAVRLGLSIEEVYRVHFRARTKLREYLVARGFDIR